MKELKEPLREHLKQIQFMLEFHGENPFKIRAFRAAREALKEISEKELQEHIKNDSLTSIKGIGKGISLVIQDFKKNSRSKELDDLMGDLPVSLFELSGLKGLGPKKIKQLVEELGIKSLSDLEYACNENRLVKLSGFGEKTQQKIMKEIDAVKSRRGKYLLSDALELAQELAKKFPANKKIKLVGAIGRKLEIVEQLDFLVLQENKKDPDEVVKKLVGANPKANSGKVITKSGIPAEFHFYPDQEFSLKAVELCCSDEHWKSLLALASKQKVNLQNKSFKSEEAVYESLGVDFHPPESREFKVKSKKQLKLVDSHQITGVFHAHTTYSDGSNSIEEMANACKNKGWKYLGLSEHSQSAFYAYGLKEAELKKQWKEIDEVNSKLSDFRILKGIESDILKDGKLDYPSKLLKQFDFVIASIHQRYGMKEMTSRLLKAIENPFTRMLGHLTGRLLLGREAYDFDVVKIVRAAIETGTIIELNSNPHRLDMDWRDLKAACEAGLVISINPDAHSVEGLEDVDYGLLMARKAEIDPKQVFNTWSAEEVFDFLSQEKSAAKKQLIA